MPGPSLATLFRQHFAHREHLYGVLLESLADDLDAGGVTAAVCVDHLDASRGDAVQLRLLAGIHRVVQRGDAPLLAPWYAAAAANARVSGDPWPAAREVLVEHADELRAALDQPPQTNEVGRSAALVIGLFAAVRRHGIRRVRLLEPGAAAGLNLLVDRFGFTGPGWAWGPTASPLVLDTEAAGVRPEAFEVVERRGCDLAPVDAASADGAAYLRSYVWPWQSERLARLDAALTLAARHPVTVDRAPASTWVRAQLAEDRPEVLTVLWQSITRQYWPTEESAAVDAAVAEAATRMPVAHLSLEGVPPPQGTDGYAVATHGPQLVLDGEVLARTHHHGPPVLLH